MPSPQGFGIAEAVQRFIEDLRPLEQVDVPTDLAVGRVLAQAVQARTLVPDSSRSAVDGWALRAADTALASTERPVRLRAAASALAGHAADHGIAPGETARITTGGVVPEGCDAVEYQEVCRAEGDVVVLERPVEPGANVRAAGEDMRPGQEILVAGCRLGPEQIALCATLGERTLSVRRRPRVRVVSTGDEIIRAGEPLPPGFTYDSNSLQIRAHLVALGAEVELVGPVRDHPDAIANACSGAAFDMLITMGGVSVGPKDHIGDVGRMLGAEIRFHWARMRPGAPTMGLRIDGRPWLGLSGNPLSAQVGFDVFGRAALGRLLATSSTGAVRLKARCQGDFHGKAPDAPRLLRASLSFEESEARALIHPYQSSGGLRALAQSNGYVVQPEGVADLPDGSLLDALLILPA